MKFRIVACCTANFHVNSSKDPQASIRLDAHNSPPDTMATRRWVVHTLACWVLATYCVQNAAAVEDFPAVVGAYEVQFDGDVLSIASATDTSTRVWETVSGTPFIQVSGGTFAVKETSGMFTVTSDAKWSTNNVTVAGWQHAGARAAASGSLHGIEVVGTVSSPSAQFFFVLTLTADASGLNFALEVNRSSVAAPWQGLRATSDDYPADRIALVYASPSDEVIFGMGSSYTYLNLKGRTVPVITSEQGVGRGLEPVTFLLNLLKNGAGGNWHTTYAPVPHYVTSRNVSFHLSNTQYSVFDFSASDSISVEVVTGADSLVLQGALLSAASPLKVRRPCAC